MKTKALALLPGLVLAGTATSAAAAGSPSIDFSPLTSAITVTDTVAAILAAAAVVILVSLTVIGVRKVMQMVRRA